MKKITIGLLGHSFCATNLGVGALTLGQCSILEEIGKALNVEIRIICFEYYVNDRYSKLSSLEVEFETISKNYFEMKKKYQKCDLILDITGGDSFSDIYGVKNFIVLMLQKIYCLFANRRIVFSPQTIGPFKHKANQILASYYLNRTIGVFTRDKISLDYAKTVLNIKSPLHLSSDVAFHMQYSLVEKINKVGINVSGLLFSKSFSILPNFSYEQLINNLLIKLNSLNYEIVLVPHVIGNEDSSDNDYTISVQLKEKYDFLEIAPKFINPIEAKNYISSLSFFIGSRMHATIASVSTGVPTVPLAYSRKFEGVFNTIEYFETIDLNSNISIDEIINQVVYKLQNQKKIINELDNSKKLINEYNENYTNYLGQVIGNILCLK